MKNLNLSEKNLFGIVCEKTTKHVHNKLNLLAVMVSISYQVYEVRRALNMLRWQKIAEIFFHSLLTEPNFLNVGRGVTCREKGLCGLSATPASSPLVSWPGSESGDLTLLPCPWPYKSTLVTCSPPPQAVHLTIATLPVCYHY